LAVRNPFPSTSLFVIRQTSIHNPFGSRSIAASTPFQLILACPLVTSVCGSRSSSCLDSVIPNYDGIKKSLCSTGLLSSWVFLLPSFLHLLVFFGVFRCFSDFPLVLLGSLALVQRCFDVGDILNSLLLFSGSGESTVDFGFSRISCYVS